MGEYVFPQCTIKYIIFPQKLDGELDKTCSNLSTAPSYPQVLVTSSLVKKGLRDNLDCDCVEDANKQCTFGCMDIPPLLDYFANGGNFPMIRMIESHDEVGMVSPFHILPTGGTTK